MSSSGLTTQDDLAAVLVRELSSVLDAGGETLVHLDGDSDDVRQLESLLNRLLVSANNGKPNPQPGDPSDSGQTSRAQDPSSTARQLHADRLAAVGQLAAGIAHEINTPIQYVGDNLTALAEMFRSMTEMLESYRSLVAELEPSSVVEDQVQRIHAQEKEKDIDYVVADGPQAIAEAQEGIGRVVQIVRAMKDFSHMGGENSAPTDVSKALESTLTIARNEYKYVADVETDLQPLPMIECFPGELNQVFLNLIVNAAHAIKDTEVRGRIRVATHCDGDYIVVNISDTGCGIRPENLRRIFDPFFTTRQVGMGTGQGLTVVHHVMEKHHGSIDVDSTVGEGTTFTLRLPITQPEGGGEFI